VSGTARLEFVSDHRPAQAVDSIILMDDTCILGPGMDSHVHCAAWQDSILLHRTGGQISCKSRSDLFVNGEHATGSVILTDGAIVNGLDCRFRIEAVGKGEQT
jgi:hypothetical protein